MNELGVITSLVVLFLLSLGPLYWLIGVYNSEDTGKPFLAGLFAWLLGYIVFLIVLSPIQIVFLKNGGFDLESLREPGVAQLATSYLNHHWGYLFVYALLYGFFMVLAMALLFWVFQERATLKDGVFLLSGGWASSNLIFVYVPAILALRNVGFVVSPLIFMYTVFDAILTFTLQIGLGFVLARFFVDKDKFALPEAVAWLWLFSFLQSIMFYRVFPLFTGNELVYSWGTLVVSLLIVIGLGARVWDYMNPLLDNEFHTL